MQKWTIFIIMALVGCSVPEGSQRERLVPARPVTSIISDTVVGTAEGAWATVQSPLEDVGLKRQPIPEKLQQIVDNPYAMPPQMLCEGIRKEIAELDAVLGADVCTIANPTGQNVPPSGKVVSRKGKYVEKGASAARDQAVGIVSSKTNILPFRGAIRYVSGADRHAKEVARAYEAGKLRRAFLKGLAVSLGPECLNPHI
jgi:hypothetical protein